MVTNHGKKLLGHIRRRGCRSGVGQLEKPLNALTPPAFPFSNPPLFRFIFPTPVEKVSSLSKLVGSRSTTAYDYYRLGLLGCCDSDDFHRFDAARYRCPEVGEAIETVCGFYRPSSGSHSRTHFSSLPTSILIAIQSLTLFLAVKNVGR